MQVTELELRTAPFGVESRGKTSAADRGDTQGQTIASRATFEELLEEIEHENALDVAGAARCPGPRTGGTSYHA